MGKRASRPRHNTPRRAPNAPPRPEPPAPSLNAAEHADRRQNAINAASRSLTTARRAHENALARFNETSPTSADAELIAQDLRAAARGLSEAWKAFHDLAGNLS